MFKVVIDIDGDQFEPREKKDLRLIGNLPFQLTKDTEIAPNPKRMEISEFGVKAYGPEWRIEGQERGYFYSRASLDVYNLGDKNSEAVKAAFEALGWKVEEGDDC